MSEGLHHAITFVLVWINIGCMTWFVECVREAYAPYSRGVQIVMGMFSIAWWPAVWWIWSREVRDMVQVTTSRVQQECDHPVREAL